MQESHVSIVTISFNSASDTPQMAPPLKSKTRLKQIVVLCLTAILYALNHALRTVWGYSKPYLADSNSYYTNPTLGYLDFSLTGAYAVGQYMNGSIGGWVNVKVLLLAGSVFSIIGLCLFAGIEGFMSLNNYFVDFYAFIFTGLGQSTGYPSCVAIISNWISLQHKGLLFGLWGTSLNIGNIIGQQIGRFTINGEGLAWQYPILITCGIFGFFLVITMIFVQVHPGNNNRPHTRVSQETSNTQLQRQPLLAQDVSSETRQLEPIAFLEAWNERNVLFFALSAFSVKGVYSGITFWLPLYLTNQVHLQGDISLLLASVEIGMIIGSVVSGPLSDKVKSRASIIMIGFFFSIIFLISIYLIRDSQSKTLYFFLLLGAGIGMGGANSLIGGTVSSDIGQYLASKKGLNATSTMVGIMEGSGAIGGAITQLVISNFTNITFSFFAGLCFFGGCCLIPVVCREYTRARA